MEKNRTKATLILLLAAAFMVFSGTLLPVGAAGKIDINSATLEQLTEIKGIGPTIAQRIIDYREEKGLFKTIDELMNVKGIGPKTLADISDMVTVAEAAD